MQSRTMTTVAVEEDTHHSCMDVVPVSWSASSDGSPLSLMERQQTACGILLEIWHSGGVLHVDEPIPRGTLVSLTVGGQHFRAEVQDYETDEFGCYLRLKTSEPWFPMRYQPSELVW